MSGQLVHSSCTELRKCCSRACAAPAVELTSPAAPAATVQLLAVVLAPFALPVILLLLLLLVLLTSLQRIPLLELLPCCWPGASDTLGLHGASWNTESCPPWPRYLCTTSALLVLSAAEQAAVASAAGLVAVLLQPPASTRSAVATAVQLHSTIQCSGAAKDLLLLPITDGWKASCTWAGTSRVALPLPAGSLVLVLMLLPLLEALAGGSSHCRSLAAAAPVRPSSVACTRGTTCRASAIITSG